MRLNCITNVRGLSKMLLKDADYDFKNNLNRRMEGLVKNK